jgi:hypothetical protein
LPKNFLQFEVDQITHYLQGKWESNMELGSISRHDKELFLNKLLEDDFRDKVVRRLFHRLGFKDGRDLCGPEEYGKDAIFIEADAFDDNSLVAVQTKVGNITLAASVNDNLTTAETQLRTALAVPYICVRNRQKMFPSKVYLCASGKINDKAREYILNQLSNDTRIRFLDRDDLIAKIDQTCPEIWLDIIADVTPYLSAIARMIEDQSTVPQDGNPLLSAKGIFVAASDTSFVDVRIIRPVTKVKHVKGRAVEDFDLEEAPSSSLLKSGGRRILLLGDAGTGKSTILLRLAYLMAKEGVLSKKALRIPVYVRAAHIAANLSKSFIDIGMSAVAQIVGISGAPFTSEDLETGNVVMLVDGLDEVANIEQRAGIFTKLHEFYSQYPACRIIVTSRPYTSLRQIPHIELFDRYRLSQISFKEAEKMMTSVKGTTIDQPRAKEILRRLESVHGMELNPLLVTVFSLTGGSDKKDIPANITELFSKFTELMLGRWDEKKGLSQQYQSKLKEHLLAQFCFRLHQNRKAQFSLAEFKEFASALLSELNLKADLEVVVNEIIERSGLMRGDDATLEFRHHLIQEFFAGKGIPDIAFIRSVVNDEWWRNPIVFYFGNNPGNVRELHDLVLTNSGTVSEACITVGLALQTCYLSKLGEKIEVWKWVIEMASQYSLKMLADAPDRKYPLLEFLSHYIIVRDAVALAGIERDDSGAPRWTHDRTDIGNTSPEMRRFWWIAGMVELGETEQVENVLREGLFDYDRLNVALHLGCYLVEMVRGVSNEARAAAHRVGELLQPRVAKFRTQVAKEFKGHLLEQQKGAIVALDSEEGETEA